MAEIINFTTGERHYTADDEEFVELVEDAGFELALCMARVDFLRGLIRDSEAREAPNVISIYREEFRRIALVATAELQAKLEEIEWRKEHLANLQKKRPVVTKT